VTRVTGTEIVMKFVAIGVHPQPEPGEELEPNVPEIEESLAYRRKQLDNGTYDCSYVMDGKNPASFIIGNAESEEDFLRVLQVPPDHPERTWTISPLLDYEKIVNDYLSGIRR
jgi:hypothetical protein